MKRSLLVPVFVVGALGALSSASAQTPPPATAVAFTGWRVVPSPGTDIVRRVFQRSRARFAACAPADVSGSVSLRMATDANGQVSTATVRRSTFTAEQSAMRNCVVSVARALRFPGSVQGTLDIEVNVVLGTAPAAN